MNSNKINHIEKNNYKDLIIKDIFKNLFKKKIDELEFNSSEWSINDFSCVFSISINNNNNNNEHFHVKIPRSKIIFLGFNHITNDDIAMAKKEYDSLNFIKLNWPKNDYINFIEPIAYLEKFNAIITRTFFGNDFFFHLKKNDLRNKFFKKSISSDIKYHLKNISKSISIHHDLSLTHEKVRDINIEKLVFKISNLIIDLDKNCVSQNCFNKINSFISIQENIFKDIYFAKTLKGLDIRNILLSSDNKICFLDPGKLKLEPSVAGIARYFVTCEMIYWGTFYFFFYFKISKNLISIIMNSIDTSNDLNKDLLKLYILKEYVKHWKQAYINIELKNKWPTFLKFFMKKIYVDRFFNKSITDLITNEKY